jgi:hypothetical protein
VSDGCFFAAEFFDPDFFDVCIPVVIEAGPPWEMRPFEMGVQLRPKAEVLRVAELQRKREDRRQVELTAEVIQTRLRDDRQRIAQEIEGERVQGEARLRRKATALENLSRAALKKELGSLDPREVVRLKNIQLKRMKALRKAHQINRRRRRP